MRRNIGNLIWKFDGDERTLIVDGGTCGKNLIWRLIDDIIIISGTGDMENYHRRLPQWNYSNRNFFRKVIIENGVTSIGKGAFIDCENLTEIVIPDSVEQIGDYAFSGCCRLENIKIPVGVERIGKRLFENCTRLPEKIFSGTCGDNLTWVINRNGTLTISGTGNMYDFPADKIPWEIYDLFVEKIIIENGVTSIGDFAFIWCHNLAEIKIPESITAIGDGAFSWCTRLTYIKIPESVTSIGACPFWDCKSLREITIPKTVTSFNGALFFLCISLEKIYYPAGRGFEKILAQGNNAELIAY